MFSKHTSRIYFSLTIVVVVAYGKAQKEISFPTSKPVDNGEQNLEDKLGVNLNSSSTVEVEERYYPDYTDYNDNQNAFGNSGTNFPGNNYNNNNYNPNGGGSQGSSGGHFSGNNNNNYNPSGSGTNYPGNNNNNYNPSGSGISYPGNNNNNYNPIDNRPNNNRPNNNYPGNNNNNNNRPNNSGSKQIPNPAPGTTVAFSALRAHTDSSFGNSQQVHFDHTVTDVGYGWNPSQSYFECHYPGTYVFSWSAGSPSNSVTRISLYENGRETGHHTWSDRNGYQSASQTAVLSLNRGARIELKLTEGRLYEPSNSGRGYTTFSGFKLN